jgi:hypothetical protein
MTARSTPTSSHRQSRPKSSAKPATKPKTQDSSDATKDSERRVRSAKEDQDRSDWEGMAPKPEQPSDDVAAPGHVPEGQH